MGDHIFTTHRLYICLLLGLFFIVVGCKKNDSVTNSEKSIDPALVNVWYSSRYNIGFDIARNGTTQPIKTDSSGKLNYLPTGSNFSLPGFGTLKALTIQEASQGNLKASISYKTSANIDTIEVIPGVYVVTDGGNQLSITFPYGSGQRTLLFQKSRLGEPPSVALNRWNNSTSHSEFRDSGTKNPDFCINKSQYCKGSVILDSSLRSE